jgi:two-component system, NarL family, response regulator NreC
VTAIRTVLADDHIILREGLRRILEESGRVTVVGEAGDGRAAVEVALRERPEVVLMDIEMPELSGTEATREIVKADPRIRVVILSMHDEGGFIEESLRCGAAAYVLKGSPSAELVQAVETVAQGRFYLSPGVSAETVAFVRGARDEGGGSLRDLTARERQVLRRIAEGFGNKEIASALHVSPRTVESHRAHLMRKLGVHKASALVRIAIRAGLVSL